MRRFFCSRPIFPKPLHLVCIQAPTPNISRKARPYWYLNRLYLSPRTDEPPPARSDASYSHPLDGGVLDLHFAKSHLPQILRMEHGFRHPGDGK
jgi:hypothetical protein